MNKLKYLSRVELFRELSVEALENMKDDIPIEPIAKGTVITAPHRSQRMIYLVKAGVVRLYTITEEGKEFTIDVLSAGHLFGDMGLYEAEANLFAVTLENSVVCKIDAERLKQIMRENPDLGIRYIEILSARLREVEELLEHMAFSSLRKRLLFLLQKLTEKFGSASEETDGFKGEPGWYRLDVEVTHQELASMTGSIRETVTEMMNRFAAEGILKKTGYRKPIWIQKERLKTALEDGKHFSFS
ncbi:Crp/Fnr family transcriptional regulator [Brevibacillus migulae]|uniref:Crp/Fnr family transcriptional regulator n=1 Tax=Brevibacillus migulae TaxID=1644114 RepID=UPI00106E700C|nr:Crp/Fnr family transcriptional regulator [Brevibacillus migulae]